MIGCVDQIQIYNERMNMRSLLQSLLLHIDVFVYSVAIDIHQSRVVEFLVNMIRDTHLPLLPDSWNSRLLEARKDSAERSIQLTLPADQWIREAHRWFGISLARFQLDGLATSIDLFYPEKTNEFENILLNFTQLDLC